MSQEQPPSKPPAPVKNIQKAKVVPKSSMKELVGTWNQTGRVGKHNETPRGWLRKMKKCRDEQNCLLHQARPGTVALREIRHYQRCQAFLISMAPFQHLIKEICKESPYRQKDVYLPWQANALFTLQTSTESYMAGFFGDVNLCTVH